MPGSLLRAFGLLLVAAAFGHPRPLAALQHEQGVSGVVRSSDGAPLEGVALLLDGRMGATSDALGRFRAAHPRSGSVRLTAERLGYAAESMEVTVPAGSWVEVDVVLQGTAMELDPIVVTGTLSETRVTDSPVKVDVVSARVLSRHAAASLMDGVGRINGLYPQVDCGVCYTNNIRINGMEGPYTAVLLNGTPIMGALASVYGLNGIHPSVVERLEILKGPQSTLHGPEAMGGVVNIITKDPRFAPELAVEASRSSLGETNASASWAPGAGRSGALFSGSVVHNDDFVDDNGDGFADLTLDTRLNLFGSLGLRREGRRIGQVTAKVYYEDRFGGVEAWTPADRGSDEVYGESIRTDRLELMGSIDGPWSDTRFEASASHHRQDSWYGDTGFEAEQTIAFGRLLWDPPRRESQHDLLVGAAVSYDRYDDDTPATSQADRRWIPGLFVEDRFHANEAWTVLGGLRADHHRHHGVIWSPRASLMWRPTADATFRVNVGTGFRVVNLFTEDHAALTGAREVIVAEELEPERSSSIAFNYNQVLDFGANPMMIDVDAFYTRFSNRIVPDYDLDPNRIVYANLGDRRSVTRGFSVALNQNFGTALPLLYSVGFTVQDVFLEGGDEPREDEFFAADYRGVWSVTWEARPGVTLEYGGALTGPMRLPRFEGEFARPTRNDPYATHDLQLSWSPVPGQRVTLGIQNLTDFTQGSPLVDPTRPFGDAFDTSYVYGPIVGRRINLGLRLTRGR